MKHVKRKFNEQIQLNFDFDKVIEGLGASVKPAAKSIADISSETPPNYIGWVVTTNNEMIKCFKYFRNDKTLMVPEPDPVLIYFNNAQINYRLIVELGSRDMLIRSLGSFKDMTPIMHNLYSFLAHSSSFAVFVFMAMECLVNKLIPDDHTIRVETQKKTEEFNSLQIQQMEFMKKVKDVLPAITGKTFWKDCPNEYQTLHDLKNFRDEIVHTKKQVSDSTHYQRLFVKAMDFDYARALYAVRDFINYYKPDLVQECDCGADF